MAIVYPDSMDPWKRLRATIDPRCGKCGVGKFMDIEVRDNPGEPMGLLFRCHGDEEFLEMSEASLRVSRRFKGYMPFTSKLSKKEREQLEAKRKEEREKISAEQKRQIKELNEQQKREIAALTQRAMQMSVTGDTRWLGVRPTCAICNRPVDQMITYEDLAALRTVFSFRCHGDVEDVPIGRTTTLSPDFPRMLQEYRPFTAKAGIIPSTQPDPRSRVSPALEGFVQKLLNDLAIGTLNAAQVKELIRSAPTPDPTFIFDPSLTPPPKPKPKPIDMLVSSKPRKIQLED